MKILLSTIATVVALSSISAQADIRIFKYKNGDIRAKTNYIKNIKHGVEVWFYKTGERKSTVNFVNGLKQGYKYIYFKNGKMKEKKLYKDNYFLPLPTDFSQLRDDTCRAKHPTESNVSDNFVQCQKAIETLLLRYNENEKTVEIMNKLSDLYETK